MGPGNPIAKQPLTVTGSITVASTAGWTSRVFTAPYHKGAMITVNRSAETGTATLALQVQYLNPATRTYHNLPGATLTATQFADSATGTGVLTIYPGITAADADSTIVLDTLSANCGQYLPDTFKIVITTTGTTNVFSIGMVLLP